MNEALLEEDKRMRILRFVIDLNQAVLMQQADLTLREAFQIMRDTRQAALNLFPGKEDVYELIYAPRFRRIIRERFVIPGGLRGTDVAAITARVPAQFHFWKRQPGIE
ncbi:MAG: hypothetical protein WA946_10160 [Nitrospirota bacterium]